MKRIMFPWVFVLCAAVPAAAQEEPAFGGTQGGAAPPAEGTPAEPAEGTAPAEGTPAETPPPAGEPAEQALPLPEGSDSSYVVERGDTLWDIVAKKLGSPWYWPKVWALNPQITNPHFIYPGDEVRFVPTDQALGKRADFGGEGMAAPEAGATTNVSSGANIEGAIPEEGGAEEEPPAGTALSDIDAPTRLNRRAFRMGGSRGLQMATPGGVFLRHTGLITTSELQEAGRLVGSFDDKAMLTTYDRVYLETAGEAKIGDRYFVYRTERPIAHPKTGFQFGFITRITGEVRVTEIREGRVVAEITEGFVPVEIGQYLTPRDEDYLRTTKPVPNSKSLEGVVVAIEDEAFFAGAQTVVYVDRGKADGVIRGNTFTVREEASHIASGAVPTEDVGMLLIIDARDNASTALVVRAVREVEVGDDLKMKPQGS